MAKTHFSGPLVVGQGDGTGAPTGGTYAGPAAVGTNIAGVDTVLQGGASTGSGAGGQIRLQVSPAGSSGTAENAMVDALTVNPTGRVLLGPTATAGRVVEARIRALPVGADATTDLELVLPNCRILRLTQRTTVAYLGSSTVTIAVGTSVGGAQLVTAADIKAKAASRVLTQVDAAADVFADFPAGTMYIRIAQGGTPSATGTGELVVEYIRL